MHSENIEYNIIHGGTHGVFGQTETPESGILASGKALCYNPPADLLQPESFDPPVKDHQAV